MRAGRGLVATVVLCAASLASSAPPAGAPTEGTRRMVARLADIAKKNEADPTPFSSAERLALLRAAPVPTTPGERWRYDLAVAIEMLYVGQTAEAMPRLQQTWVERDRAPAGLPPLFLSNLREQLAVGYLRLGEQENCIRHHGTESCLLPIRGTGVHSEPRGSRAAIAQLEAILADKPLDLTARWLLNLAYMTLGEYPDKVKPALLIPPSAFESDYDIKRFVDVAARAGVDVTGRAGAAILDDLDGDGHLDLFLSSMGLRDPLHVFRNRGDGTFEDRSAAAGLAGIVGGLNAVHADYDNDGDLDVFVLRGAWMGEKGRMPNSLLRNRGDGTFDDVTDEAGVLSFHPTQVGAWADYDNDGWVDLFVGNESTVSASPHPCELWHNDRDGTFTNVAREAGVAVVGFIKGAVWGDYDNDGRPDLYVTDLSLAGPNRLFHNDGKDASGIVKFTDVAERAGVREPREPFPTWFFDYDNDGWLDLFVSGYVATPGDVAADYLGLPNRGEKPRLYRNRGNGTFAEVSREMHVDKVLLTMGCNFGDLDNDGWLDFYVGTGNPDFRTLIPNRMFRNAGGKVFQDVTTSGGFGHLQKGHGVAFGDLDLDGDQDMFLKIGGAFTGDTFQSALFENPGHGNHWITLALVGTRTNRAAIGARIRVTVEQAGAVRDIHASVTSGSSFGGSSLRQEIGLGSAERIRRIEIRWPGSAEVQAFDDVALDRMYVVREGRADLEPLAVGPRRAARP
jgi:FG-GAP-like repeat/ASPIC and UnbV